VTDKPKEQLKQPELRLNPGARRTIRLDQKRGEAFAAALSAPPKDNPRLRKLLSRKPAWEK
jgi:uncharacterized protein (DUF1778 family)